MVSSMRGGRLIGVVAVAAVGCSHPLGAPVGEPWRRSFAVDPSDLVTVGANRYFILQPGYRLTLEGREHGEISRLVITVLDETRTVGGVETRVVEERETRGDTPLEVSRNYFAISSRTNEVFYFGEDVDTYKGGKIAGHDGGWQHGSNGARFGLMMPGEPAVGARYFQEQAPGVAMDRAEVVSVAERATTPAGTFDGCLKTKETTPLESFAKEYKLYAPGVGLIKDGSLELVSLASAAR